MKVLVIGEINSANLGDKAIYLTLKYLFESQGHKVSGLDLGRRNEFCETQMDLSGISIGALCSYEQSLCQNTKTERDSGIKFCRASIVSRMPALGRKCVNLYSKKRHYLKRNAAWEEKIKENDVVIFGGGALLMDNCWGFPLSLLYTSKLVKKLGKPYGCVGCSVGETFSYNGARWLKQFLGGSSFVTVRDPISGHLLEKLGVPEYRVYADTALSISNIIMAEKRSFKGVIGINVLSYVHQVKKSSYRKYLRVLEESILKVVELPQLGLKQVILFNSGERKDVNVARLLHYQVQQKAGNPYIKVCRQIQNLAEICYLVSNCDVVVGSRLHSSIISKSYGTPIIGIAWDKKVTGFYEMLKLKSFCFDYKTVNSEMLIQAIEVIKNSNFHQDSAIRELLAELEELPEYVVRKMKK